MNHKSFMPKRLRGSRQACRDHRSAKARYVPLRCEPLEDRRLLAALLVNSELDNIIPGDGLVTLREAIIAANGDYTTDLGHQASGFDEITFDPSLDGKTIAISIAGTDKDEDLTSEILRKQFLESEHLSRPDAGLNGDLDITDPAGLTITGNGADKTIIDAQGLGRVFDVALTSGPVTFGDITITGGAAVDDGGGIRSLSSAPVAVIGTTIANNSAGAINDGASTFPTSEGGGGIFAASELSIQDSIISGNSAANGARGGGGVLLLHLVNSSVPRDSTTLTIANSAIVDNAARSGGGVLSRAQRDGAFEIAIFNSTISDNKADQDGGGIRGDEVTLTDSTITGNSSGRSGGGVKASRLTIEGSIISANSALAAC